jgi:hypothetical protein
LYQLFVALHHDQDIQTTFQCSIQPNLNSSQEYKILTISHSVIVLCTAAVLAYCSAYLSWNKETFLRCFVVNISVFDNYTLHLMIPGTTIGICNLLRNFL